MGRKPVDLSGRRFTRLVALRQVKRPDDRHHAFWECRCDCGNVVVVRKDSLYSGHAKSCGCLLKEYKPITHGQSHTRLYSVWSGIKDRCFNENSPSYSIYGGRGITICDEWKDSFDAFYEWAIKSGYDENKCRSEQSIDRIDVNGNYEPSNCRWADKDTQNYNKRDTQRVNVFGKEMTLKEISDLYSISIITVRSRYCRYKKGLATVEQIISKEKIINKPQQILINVNGIEKNLTQWEKETGVSRKTIAYRYKRGVRKYEELFKKGR